MCSHNRLAFKADGRVLCRDCGAVIPDKPISITQCPSIAKSPNIGSTKDLLKHYGVTNARTGEGITKDTDVRDPVGLSSKAKNKRAKWV